MVKYIKQPNLSSCGPVSVLNLGKHLGRPFTLKDLPYLKKICKTNKDGTDPEMVSKALKINKFNFLYKNKISLNQLHKALKVAPVIIGYCKVVKEGEKLQMEGHYMLIIKSSKTSFTVVNYVSDKNYSKVNKYNRPYYIKTLARISIKQMVRYLKPMKFDGENYFPDLWISKGVL